MTFAVSDEQLLEYASDRCDVWYQETESGFSNRLDLRPHFEANKEKKYEKSIFITTKIVYLQ